ncbi:MAG TPA: hypothetical protein VLA13_00530, partial [Massilibacterium sp.]|nr:hypothetical protein [Massilibacterium sp.]
VLQGKPYQLLRMVESMGDAVEETINKIIYFYLDVNAPANKKINEWFQNEPESVDLFIELCKRLFENGWNIEDSFLKYQDDETRKISQKLYDKAMRFFRKDDLSA